MMYSTLEHTLLLVRLRRVPDGIQPLPHFSIEGDMSGALANESYYVHSDDDVRVEQKSEISLLE
jgi:hypothetical protein